MSDFFQNGVITTLHKLRSSILDDLEAQMIRLAGKRKVALLLPALYSELEGPAMKPILEALAGTKYIHEWIVTMDQATPEQFREARDYLKTLFPDINVVWNNGPRIEALYRKLEEETFPVAIPGKGRSVWMGMGYILARDDSDIIALHDCDIVNYSRCILARLVYPLMASQLGFEFTKGFYARATERLYGRVTRLFVTPIIRALKGTVGKLHFLEYLDSFRYPLAGEFAMETHLAERIRIAPDWGLEISSLGEVYKNTSLKRICQVELTDSYDHKHQELIPGEPGRGLMRMTVDIARTLFRILAQDGIILTDSLFRTLTMSYINEARDAVEKYHALAAINGMVYDLHAEITAVETFSTALQHAVDTFSENPMGAPLIPSWIRIWSALPDFAGTLVEAVEADNAA